jgi:hypothetical protein
VIELSPQLNPDSAVNAGSEAQSWSSEGVRLGSFKMILRSLTPSRSGLSNRLKAALIDACGEAETRRLRCGKILHRDV